MSCRPACVSTNDDYLDETFVEPRLGAVWRLSNTLSLNTAAGRYHQQPQEILPMIGNPALRAPVADHFVAGFDKSFSKQSERFAQLTISSD